MVLANLYRKHLADMAKKSILLHQRKDASANILWSPPLSEEEERFLKQSLIEFIKLDYWASPYPEGDGITLTHKNYNNLTAIRDIKSCFPWLDINELAEGQSFDQAIQDLNRHRKIKIRYLVPAEKLLIYDDIVLGPYKIHQPVVPDFHPAYKHSWAGHLLDIIGADVDPTWNPQNAPQSSHAHLLQYPLIEGEILVDGFLLYPTGSGVTEWEPLTLQVTDHADRAMDILRHDYCHYKNPHYAPHHAGVLASREFRMAYLMPECIDIKPQLIAAKSSVFEVINVWLGLELNSPPTGRDRLARIASGLITNEIEGKIRNALRVKGQSFLLSNNEMRFVSMIFAADSVACVKNKRGEAQRKHIAAAASGSNINLYREILDDIIFLYGIRNEIVHVGRSFLETGMNICEILQKTDRILSLCIENALESGIATQDEFATMIDRRLDNLISYSRYQFQNRQ